MEAAFESVLSQLSEQTGTTLEIDPSGICLLKLESQCSIQLEWNLSPARLHIYSKLGELPSALPLRKAMLISALKANAAELKGQSILCYSDIHKQLMLYLPLSVENLDIQQLIGHLKTFETTALLWTQALKDNRPPAQVGDQPDQSIFAAMQWRP